MIAGGEGDALCLTTGDQLAALAGNVEFDKLALVITGKALSHISGRPALESRLLSVARLCRVGWRAVWCAGRWKASTSCSRARRPRVRAKRKTSCQCLGR